MFEEAEEFFGRLDVDYIKTTIQDLLNNSDEYARQRALDFLKVITFEKEAERYIKTHDDYRAFALDNADVMQIFKDGAEIGFQKGIKAKIKDLEKENAELKAQIEELKKYYKGFEVMFDFKSFTLQDGGKR